MGANKRLPRDEIFFSHSSQDRPFVDRTVRVLRGYGLRVWHSSTSIVGAQQWHDEIGKALARCNWFVVVLSPQSVRSRWVKRELLYALENRRYDGRIIPILYRKCEVRKLSWTLTSFEMVDFRRSIEAAYVNLLEVWGLRYKRKP
jgi:TIR domain